MAADPLGPLNAAIDEWKSALLNGEGDKTRAVDSLQEIIFTDDLVKKVGQPQIDAILKDFGQWADRNQQAKKSNGRSNDGRTGPIVIIYEWGETFDINKNLKTFMVGGMIGRNEISVFYGAPESGKSTVVIDLACCIATGKKYHGREVMQGPVLYVAAERAHTVRRRVIAWAQKYNDSNQNFPFALVDMDIDLRERKVHTKALIEAAERIFQETGKHVVWVIFDTLSRVLFGGDENSSKDMGRLVVNIAHLFRESGAHISLVHHSPLESLRLRGWGGINGAMDTTVRVEKTPDKVIIVEVDKASDMPEDIKPKFYFKIESENIGPEQTAGVIVPEKDYKAPEKPPKEKARGRKKNPKGKEPPGLMIAEKALTECMIAYGTLNNGNQNIPSGVRTVKKSVWKKKAISMEITDSDAERTQSEVFSKCFSWMRDNELIAAYEGLVWRVPESARRAEQQTQPEPSEPPEPPEPSDDLE